MRSGDETRPSLASIFVLRIISDQILEVGGRAGKKIRTNTLYKLVSFPGSSLLMLKSLGMRLYTLCCNIIHMYFVIALQCSIQQEKMKLRPGQNSNLT